MVSHHCAFEQVILGKCTVRGPTLITRRYDVEYDCNAVARVFLMVAMVKRYPVPSLRDCFP